MKRKIIILFSLGVLGVIISSRYWQADVPKADLRKDYLFGEENLELFKTISDAKFVTYGEALEKYEKDREFLVYEIKGKKFAVPLDIISFHHVIELHHISTNYALSYCLLSDTANVFLLEAGHRIKVNGQLYFGNAVLVDSKLPGELFLQINGQGFDNTNRLRYLASGMKLKFSELLDIKNSVMVFVPDYTQYDEEFYANFLATRRDGKYGILSAEIFRPESIQGQTLEKGYVTNCGLRTCFLVDSSPLLIFARLMNMVMIPSYRYNYAGIFSKGK